MMPVPYTECITYPDEYYGHDKILRIEQSYYLTEYIEEKAHKLINLGGRFLIKREEVAKNKSAKNTPPTYGLNTLIFSTDLSEMLLPDHTKIILSSEKETRKNFIVLINSSYHNVFKNV